MKDRLQELKQKTKEIELSRDSQVLSVEAEEQGIFVQQAVIYEREPVEERHLHEIQKLQENINNFADDVRRFGQHQKSLVASMRRFSLLKRDSTIAKEIKIQAEHINKALGDLVKEVKKSEAENGPSSVVTRILKSQYAAMFHHFQQTMFIYNDTIAAKQERCKTFIFRQLEVAGKEVPEDEVNDMLQCGKWEVFNESLLTETSITKAQLSEIEQRHKELVNLENQVKDLRDLFIQISLLVEEQGEDINNIEMIVNSTKEYVDNTKEKFGLAAKYKRRNPCRALCCCCPAAAQNKSAISEAFQLQLKVSMFHGLLWFSLLHGSNHTHFIMDKLSFPSLTFTTRILETFEASNLILKNCSLTTKNEVKDLKFLDRWYCVFP